MLDGAGQVSVLVTDEMIEAGFAAARDYFFDDTDASVVTPDALREIYEAMHRSSDQGVGGGTPPFRLEARPISERHLAIVPI